jgi:hypothetical protein
MRARTPVHPRVSPKGTGPFPMTAGDIVQAEQIGERVIRLTSGGWIGYSPSVEKVDGLRRTFGWKLEWITGKVEMVEV